MTDEYLSMFIDETREHLQAWSDGLLELEQKRDTTDVSIVFRAAHTIKGMAMTMGFQRMGDLTHRAENLLDGIRQGVFVVDSGIVDALFKALDLLEQLLDGIEQNGSEPELDSDLVASTISALTGEATLDSDAEVGATAELAAEQFSMSQKQGELNPSQLVANAAIGAGYRVFEMVINFEPTCQMPMARWAQVLQLMNQDNILYTDPSASVLESGNYGGTIRFAFATQDDVEVVGQKIAGISEVNVESLQEWAHAHQFVADRQGVLPEGNVTADPYVIEVVKSALTKGISVFEVGVRLHQNTALKSARLYMVFEAIGGQDKLLYTQPVMSDIEQEKVDTDVLFIMWSDDGIEGIRRALESVTQVELVELRQWEDQNGQPKRGENTVVRQEASRRSARRTAPTVRVDTDKLDALMNLFSELVIDRTRLEQIAIDLGHDELSQTVTHMSRIADELQDIVMNIRMVPVSTVFTRFPRMVRDTALQLGKEVDFEVTGQETELDRTVVEEIGDPIMHMLRNSLDHGLESTDTRRRLGKPETGHIVLRAYSAGNSVFIEVEDDGGGIDTAVVRQKAVTKGLIEAGGVMSDDEVYQLLFAPGFSTSDEVSDLSGRGVGLDVVKAKIEALSGRIEIQSEQGKGTKFIIQLPMTLAIMQGLMVSVADTPYFLPLGSVVQVETGISTKVLDGKEITLWRQEVVPLVRLRNIFELDDQDEGYTVFIRRGDKTLGLAVDDVLGQQQVVLKALDRHLRSVKWLSGATILGDGTVALILDSNAFFQK